MVRCSFKGSGAHCLSLVALLLLAGCAKRSESISAPEATEATLILTTLYGLGNTDFEFSYTQGDQRVVVDLKRTYNPPTGHDAMHGDLSPIYEMVTGSQPEDPLAYQDAESIIQVCRSNGWRIVEDTEEKVPTGNLLRETVRTIRFESD